VREHATQRDSYARRTTSGAGDEGPARDQFVVVKGRRTDAEQQNGTTDSSPTMCGGMERPYGRGRLVPAGNSARSSGRLH